MNKKEIMNESILLEERMAELYRVFAEKYEKDKLFWKNMAREEVNHAGLLEGIRDLFLNINSEDFPESLIYDDLEELKRINKSIEEFTIKVKYENIEMNEAYNFAYEIENSAFELHYDEQLKIKSTSLMEMFKKLNGFDKDHARRIKLLIDRK